MRPRVTKRERKLHLRYELPDRVHCSHIYPITAPNGSSVIIYGSPTGLRVLWRGGRRRKEHAAAPPKQNGSKHSEVMVIDDDDEPEKEPKDDEYELEEEELDPDCPYPSIIQDLDIPIGSSVLHIAVPPVQSSALTPSVLKSSAVVAIASGDGAVRTLQIPLAPPKDDEKDEIVSQIAGSQIGLAPHGPVASGLSAKFLPIDNQPLTAPRLHKEGIEGHLLVAAASRALSIWTVPVTADALLDEDQKAVHRVHLPTPLSSIAFHPSTRSAQILVADPSGAARIYDPYATKMALRRPTSSDSIEPAPVSSSPGKWVMTYHTSFPPAKDSSLPPAVARRKKILDAKWVLGGKGILALLEDSQWGIWDVTGSSKAGKNVEDFAIDGYLTAPSANEPTEPTRPKKGGSKLAPMTPNTRKSKSELFYSGESKSKASTTISKGGISASSNHPRSGQTDESAVLWYNSDIYTIPSMQSFWQRSTTTGGGIGSLYAPGISHVPEIDPMHENITSISHFATKSSSAGIGQMNTQRDLFVSTEFHAIILQQLRPPTPARSLFQIAERPASAARDQQMLDAGTLGLDGMDRMLDSMAAGALPVARKVGFAT